MATLIKPDGTTEEVLPKNGREFTKQELDALVTPGESGYLEALRVDNGRWLWLHEEGKFRRLSPNMVATMLFMSELPPGDVIVGNVLLTEPGEVR